LRHCFKADAPQFFPGIEREAARKRPGGCPEIVRLFRRIIRRTDFGNADGDPADIRADGSRYCGVIAAGDWPDTESFASEGVRLVMLKGGWLVSNPVNHFV
jgi:hypothetical protein